MAFSIQSPRYDTINSNVKWYIDLTIYDQSEDLLRSYVYVRVIAITTNGSSVTNNTYGDVWFRINDQSNIYSSEVDIGEIVSPGGTILINRGAFTVDHSSADSPVSFKVEANITGTSWTNDNSGGSTTYTFTIPGIIQKNTISSIAGGTIGGTMTVNINKPNTTTSTRVYLQVNGCEWFTAVGNSSETSISFTVPNNLANHMPNEVTAVGRVIIRTYYNGVVLADPDHEWNKEFHVPDWMKYDITSVGTFSDVKTNGYDRFIQGKTKLKITPVVNNVNAYGATILETKFTIDGNTYYNTNTWTNVLYTSGSRPLEVTLTDSRGRVVTYNTTITVHEYKNPWGFISGYRCDINGNRDDTNGTYFKLTYSADRSSIDGANTFAALIESKEAGSETWHEVEWSSDPVSNKEVIAGSVEYPYPLDKQFNIRLTVSDWFTSTEYIVTMQTGLVFLDFRAGGTGLGVNMICTEDDTFQIDAEFDIYPANPKYGTHSGADLIFNNVSKESQKIGWCGGSSSSNYLLALNRFTSSDNGNSGILMEIDRYNVCYNNCKVNHYANDLTFYKTQDMPSSAYGVIRYKDSSSYFYCEDNENIGFYSDTNGYIMYYDSAARLLYLKSGYGQSSDKRFKYDFNEFKNWNDYYNFYMSLKPQTFKYNDDMFNETHIGLIAQDVDESIKNNNLLGYKLGLVKHSDEDLYTLAYHELIPLNIKMIQKHENDIQELKDKVAKFKETANKLKKN